MRSSQDKLKRFLWDLSGAFGDIGVLFPIAIALIVRNGFNPTALFLMAGIFYVASARYFRITMPVQPLKAMSAIAIATGLGCEVINAAGLAMGVILLMLSFTGLSVRLGAMFPLSVIRGIQLGLGLMLMKGSWGLMRDDVSTALTAAVVLAACLLFFKKVPPLLPLLLLGVVVAMRNAPSAPLGPVPLLFLRMERAAATASRVAHWLADNPVRWVRVLHPELMDDPAYRAAYRRQCSGAGSTFSIVLDGGREAAFRFINALTLFKSAVSLGGTESLLCHPASTTHSGVPAEVREQVGVSEGLIRMSIGLEHGDDLIADLESALRA